MLDFAFPFAGAADCDARVEPRNQDTAFREALASNMMKEGLGSDVKQQLLERRRSFWGILRFSRFTTGIPRNIFFLFSPCGF